MSYEFDDFPIAPQDTEWDSSEANKRGRIFTKSENEPSSDYKKLFFWYDRENENEYGAYKLQFVDVINGRLEAVPHGIFAAAAAVEGARGGVDIPSEDRPSVVRHINRYYEKMGLNAPFEPSDFTVDGFEKNNEIRYDSYPVKSVKVDSDGTMRGAALVTKCGVFPYKNNDGSIRFELRHPDDVFNRESLDSLKLKPVTNQHPPLSGNPPSRLVTPENFKKLAIGTTGENPKREGEFVSTSVVINDESGIKAIQAGCQQLSCGYHCDVMEEEGFFEGMKYSHRQKNIRYNHLSIVHNGRAGSSVRLNLDSLEDLINENNVEENFMSGEKMESVRIDGISYKADPEVINKLNTYEEGMKSLKEKVDSLEDELNKSKLELETTKAHRDDFKDKLEKSEKIDHDEEIRKHAKILAHVMGVAKQVDPEMERLDNMNSEEIMTAVVSKKFPNLDISDKSIEYITARFDVVCEDLKSSESPSIWNQRKALISREDSVEKLSPRDKWINKLNAKKDKGDK